MLYVTSPELTHLVTGSLELSVYFWLPWVFIAALSLVAVNGGYSFFRCTDFSLPWLLLLRNTGPRCIVVAHGLSCPAACGIFPDQGSNLCLLHQQVDSYPLHHQEVSGSLYCYSHAFLETNSLRRTMQIVECSLLHRRAQGKVFS